MNWRERIIGSYQARSPDPGISGKPGFYPAASEEAVADAETRLDVAFPISLRSLLLESNGVMDMMAIDVGGFSLTLSHDYRLDVFPDGGSHGEDSEHWRLFAPGSDKEHFVVS